MGRLTVRYQSERLAVPKQAAKPDSLFHVRRTVSQSDVSSLATLANW